MNLCSDDHDEVCFEGRKCPVCEKQKQLDQVQRDSDLKDGEIEELKSEIKELKNS